MFQDILEQLKENRVSEITFNQWSVINYNECTQVLNHCVKTAILDACLFGDYVIINDEIFGVYIYNLRTKSALQILNNCVCQLFQCSTNEKIIAVIDKNNNNRLLIWDFSDISNITEKHVGDYQNVQNICVFDDIHLMIITLNKSVKIINHIIGDVIEISRIKDDKIEFINKWTSNEFVIITENNSIYLWKSLTSELILLLDRYPSKVRCLAIDKSHGLALACDDNKLIVWDKVLENYSLIYAKGVSHLLWLSNGNLVMIDTNRMINIWQSSTKLFLGKLNTSSGIIRSIQRNKHDSLLVVSSGNILNGKIETYNFINRPLRFSDIIFAFPILKKSHSLDSLNFDGIKIDADNLSVIFYLILSIAENNGQNFIHRISLRKCNLTNPLVLRLISFVKRCPYLVYVNINENEIDNNLISELQKQIEKNSNTNLITKSQYQSKEFADLNLWHTIENITSYKEFRLDFTALFIMNHCLTDEIPVGFQNAPVSCLISFSKSKYLSATWHGSVCLHDIETKQIVSIRTKNLIKDYSKTLLVKITEKNIIMTSKGVIEIWDIEKKNLLRRIEEKEHIYSAIALANGFFLTGYRGLKIILWDQAGNKISAFSTGDKKEAVINAMALYDLRANETSDKIFLITGDSSGIIRRSTIENGQLFNAEILYTSDSCITSLVISKSNLLICGSTKGQLIIIDLQSNKLKHKINAHTQSINCITILSDTTIACGSSDRTISIFDIEHGEKLNTLKGHSEKVNSLTNLGSNYLISSTDFSNPLFSDYFSDRPNLNINVWQLQPFQLTPSHVKLVLARCPNFPVFSLILDGIPLTKDLFHELFTFIKNAQSLYYLSLAYTSLNAETDSIHIDHLLMCIEQYNFSLINVNLSNCYIFSDNDEKRSKEKEKFDKQLEKLKNILSRNNRCIYSSTPLSIVNEEILHQASLKSSTISNKEQLLISENNLVTVHIWRRQWVNDRRIGHVSLKTYGLDAIHASYWPTEDNKDSFSRKGTQTINIADVILDQLYEGDGINMIPPDETVHLFSLNVKEINLHYRRFKSLNYNWSLWGSSMFRDETTRNCSGLVYELLNIGGLNKILPNTTKGEVTGALSWPIANLRKIATLIKDPKFTAQFQKLSHLFIKDPELQVNFMQGLLDLADTLTDISDIQKVVDFLESKSETSSNLKESTVPHSTILRLFNDISKMIMNVPSLLLTPDRIGDLVKEAKNIEIAKYEYTSKDEKQCSIGKGMVVTEKKILASPHSLKKLCQLTLFKAVEEGKLRPSLIENLIQIVSPSTAKNSFTLQHKTVKKDNPIKSDIVNIQKSVYSSEVDFNHLSYTWYTDEDINILINLKVGQIKGFLKDHQFLLAGIDDGKYPDEDNHRYITLITPAIDTKSKALLIDYFFDKSKQPRNSLAILLEKSLIFLSECSLSHDHINFKNKLNTYISNDISPNDKGDSLNVLLETLNELSYNQAAIQSKIEQLNQKSTKDIFDEIEDLIKLSGDLHIKLLFPYNRTQMHWLTGEIKIHRSNSCYTIEITAHDPKGKGNIELENERLLCLTLEKKIKAIDSNATFKFQSYKSAYPPRQLIDDDNSCGVIMVEDLFKRILGQNLIQQNPYPNGAHELRQQHIALVEQKLLISDGTRIQFLNRHQNIRDEKYYYNVADGLYLLVGIRKRFLNYEKNKSEYYPFKNIGEQYSCYRENNSRIFLADPYFIDHFEKSFDNDINIILGAHAGELTKTNNTWVHMPVLFILPLLTGNHWRLVRVEINYLTTSASILWDDPMGVDAFDNNLKLIIYKCLYEKIQLLLKYELKIDVNKISITEFNLDMEQQVEYVNSWDCGPIIFDNIINYIDVNINNEQIASALTLDLFKTKAANYETQIQKIRTKHHALYKEDKKNEIHNILLHNANKLMAVRHNYLETLEQAKNLEPLLFQIKLWKKTAIVRLFENLETLRLSREKIYQVKPYTVNEFEIAFELVKMQFSLQNQVNQNKLNTLKPNFLGLFYTKSSRDGQYLFHAIAFSLYKDPASLRREVSNYLELNLDKLKEFITLKNGQSYDEYIQTIRENKEYSDNIDIEILMRVYNRPIIVLEKNGQIRTVCTIDNEIDKLKPIFVLYNAPDSYKALIRPSNVTDRDILRVLMQQHENEVTIEGQTWNII